jgi:hypothetical protein
MDGNPEGEADHNHGHIGVKIKKNKTSDAGQD